MAVVRWIRSLHRSTRAEAFARACRELAMVGSRGTHGYAENGDPLHRGEDPPRG